MGLVRRIATRFVLDKRAGSDPAAHGFVSFIALISITGLALGVTALLVVTSVMNGFERELKRALTAFHGHIILFSRGEPLSRPDRYIQEIRESFPEVTAVSPYVFAEAMLSSSKGVAGAVIEGIDRGTVEQVSEVGNKLTAGRLPERVLAEENPEITLGSEVARKLGAKPGDHVVLTVPFAREGGAPLVRRLKVVGVVRLGMHDYDSKYSLMHIADFQNILEIPGRVNAFKIMTRDAEQSLRTAAAINDKYVYPLRARDWSSLNRNLFYAIRLEKVVIAIILMAIVLVASFNIISTIMMMVYDKLPQISILKALGFRPRRTFAVFALIGSVMAVSGTIMGLGLGRALCALVAWKSIVDLPADIYMFSRLPIEIRPFEWALICLLTIGLALASTLWPSYRVSRQGAVEGLRYE